MLLPAGRMGELFTGAWSGRGLWMDQGGVVYEGVTELFTKRSERYSHDMHKFLKKNLL